MKPYVILNAAMTLDGKIVTAKNSSNISGEEDLKRVHELRREVDGIMVGIGTVLADDPRLTVHKVDATPQDNPVRIVVDSKLRTPIAARITNKDARTIIAGANEFKYDFLVSDRCEVFRKRDVEFFFSGDKRVDLNALMNYLASEGIEKLSTYSEWFLAHGSFFKTVSYCFKAFISSSFSGSKDFALAIL